MTIKEYKVVADFYPDKVAQEIRKLQEDDWELLDLPAGMHSATLNHTKAPKELNVWHCWQDTLFYAVLAKYEEITYDTVSQTTKHRDEVLGHQEGREGLPLDSDSETENH